MSPHNEPKPTRKPARGTRAASAAPPVPPYGLMPGGWEEGARNGPLPVGFTADTWSAFFEQTRDAIAEVLWPHHDGARWQGQAVAAMEALTRADFDLLERTFRAVLDKPVGSTGDLAMVSHKVLFMAEDDMPVSGGLFETMRRYLAGQPAAVVAGAVTAARAANIGVMGPRPLAFKRALQRPRPWQMALLMGRPFSHEHAKSAASPAIMSGHSLQGLFAAAAAYLDQQQQFDQLPGARRALAQFGVDFGDRRVFAGVHYPSDNLASWFIDLKMAPVCFGPGGPAAKAFMADAIRSSRVHAALVEAAKDPTSPFALPLQWLEAAM
jgi:hypothetical protein